VQILSQGADIPVVRAVFGVSETSISPSALEIHRCIAQGEIDAARRHADVVDDRVNLVRGVILRTWVSPPLFEETLRTLRMPHPRLRPHVEA